eukprot:CAMPEP_0198281492 /NCGR_PEP_ID=MMETSP1449-20131203/1413_1 /TAXON_ID=420275 /ORGANISM="Attheya septentrionalis, Strain CCMP2084" /LENGTH=211 /DNA_ID=CAMNT_0043977277 /DNA_START=45 /DNA_END=680 /DNA_ORIENTATION=+
MLSRAVSASLAPRAATAVSCSRVTSEFGRVVLSQPLLDQQEQQVRWKHSATQIKRLFKKNPARVRIEKAKLGLDSRRFPSPSQTAVERTYPQLFEPKLLVNGWSAPPPGDFCRPSYPFGIARTGNKPNNAAGFLPIYSDFRVAGSKKTTLIRKVTGDIDAFIAELRIVLDLPVPINLNPNYDKIRMRTGGTIEIDGMRSREVREWLAGLGF